VSGKRLVIGAIVMGILLPVTLYFLLDLQTVSQFLTIAASSFLAWGLGDLLANIMERPRLQGRTPGRAIREDIQRRAE
jgi:hypothetical protein